MEYYVDQLDAISALIKALNGWEQNHGQAVQLQQNIAVHELGDPESVLGHLVDEIGGVWAFRPVSKG